MDFQSKNEKNNNRKILWNLYKQKLFTDVKLEIDEIFYECHRIILISNSSYFYDLFMNDFQENYCGGQEIYIHVPDKHENFRFILKYLYTGKMNFINPSNAYDIYALSWYFQLDELQMEAENVINKSDILINQVISFISDYSFIFIPKCKNCSLIAGIFYKIMKFNESNDLEYEVLLNILSDPHLKIHSEKDFVKWIIHYSQQNGVNVSSFNDMIKWKFLSKEDFTEVVSLGISASYAPIERERKLYQNIHPKLINLCIALNSSSYEKALSILNRYEIYSSIDKFEDAEYKTVERNYNLKFNWTQNNQVIIISAANDSVYMYIKKLEIIINPGTPVKTGILLQIGKHSDAVQPMNNKYTYNNSKYDIINNAQIQFQDPRIQKSSVKSFKLTGFSFNINKI